MDGWVELLIVAVFLHDGHFFQFSGTALDQRLQLDDLRPHASPLDLIEADHGPLFLLHNLIPSGRIGDFVHTASANIREWADGMARAVASGDLGKCTDPLLRGFPLPL